jgi:hypothetical protein
MGCRENGVHRVADEMAENFVYFGEGYRVAFVNGN